MRAVATLLTGLALAAPLFSMWKRIDGVRVQRGQVNFISIKGIGMLLGFRSVTDRALNRSGSHSRRLPREFTQPIRRTL